MQVIPVDEDIICIIQNEIQNSTSDIAEEIKKHSQEMQNEIDTAKTIGRGQVNDVLKTIENEGEQKV